jgi:hypothetical protein
MYGNDLKFLAISVGTDIQAMLLGFREGDPIMESWEQFLNKQVFIFPVKFWVVFFFDLGQK